MTQAEKRPPVEKPAPIKRVSSKRADVTPASFKGKQTLQPANDHSHMSAYGTASHLPQKFTEGTDSGAVTTTTFTADSPVCAVTFAAPPTGRIYVTVTAQCISATILEGFEIRETNAAGTVFLTAAVTRTVEVNNNEQASYRTLVEGLIPGKQYFCQTMYRTLAGTGRINRRELLIEPVV